MFTLRDTADPELRGALLRKILKTCRNGFRMVFPSVSFYLQLFEGSYSKDFARGKVGELYAQMKRYV